jgi:hypothetical protein
MAFDQPSDSDSDTPDWLKGLQPEDGAADSGPNPAGAGSWDDEQEAPESAPAAGEGEVPEWLANIREKEKPEEEPPLEDTGSLSSEDKQDTANWLEKIRVQYAQDTGQLEIPAGEAEAEKPSGDYIERVQALKAQDEAVSEEPQQDQWLDDMMEEPAVEPDADDSGWGKSGGQSGAEGTPSGIWDPEAAAPEEEEDQGPDWLSGLPSIDTDNLPDEGEAQPAAGGSDVPEWLRGMEPESDPALDAVPGFTAELADSEGPDWLDDGSSEQKASSAAEAVDEQFPGLPGEPGEGSLPNWLDNLKFSPDDTSKQGKAAAILPEYSEEDVSALLFEADDLPDWLSDEAGERGAAEAPSAPPLSAEAPQPEQADEDIAPAELPSWLQAMRPIEAVTATVTDEEEEEIRVTGEEERVGPLAGLSDILPAEPHIVQFGTRSVPITGFQLSPAQKSYAQLLKSMVDSEAAAPPVSRRQVAVPQQFLRWVLAILLMLVVFAGAWINSSTIDLPIDYSMPNSTIPVEERAVVELIQGLGEGSQVLVAFEYQPGFSGEMEAAAEAVLRHLFSRNVNVSLLSTQATGPDMAERFFDTKLAITQDQYTNLGYLTGGAAGLANYAAAPTAAIHNSPIQDIRQYAMVVVITEDPDLARIWIEQVQTRLDPNQTGSGTPMVMIVSAQAEPLVYPFFQSNPRQVSGMVSGVVGGAIYEHQVTGTAGTAGNYWFTYNLALQIATVLIAGISIINLVGAILRKLRKPSRRGNA